MFNEPLKIQFMNDYKGKSKTIVKTIFNKAAPMETELNKDLCKFDKIEMQRFLRSVFTASTSTNDQYYHGIKVYLDYCKSQQIVPEVVELKELRGIVSDSTDRIKVSMFSSPLHLQKVMNEIFDPLDQCTIDIIKRAYLWLAYSGISVEKALLITSDHLDFEEMEIYFEGSYYEIYKESKQALKMCCELDQLRYIHPKYTTMRNRIVDDSILRGFSSTTRKYIEHGISMSCKNSKHKLIYKNVYMSGMFYRLYERERAGIEADFLQIISMEIEGSNYNFKDEKAFERYIKVETKKKIADYEAWKRAFN